MKSDIILSGVGGQGILSIATVLGEAAIIAGLYIKQAEAHGMSQRGGDVQSSLRISSEPVMSDLIPKGKADLIISLEPMEALRYLPYLGTDGWIITSSVPFVNIGNYPDTDVLLAEVKKLEKHVLIDVDAIAAGSGSSRSGYMVLLGAASPFIGIGTDKIEEGIRIVFSRKGESVVNMNLKAFRAGAEYSRKKIEANI